MFSMVSQAALACFSGAASGGMTRRSTSSTSSSSGGEIRSCRSASTWRSLASGMRSTRAGRSASGLLGWVAAFSASTWR